MDEPTTSAGLRLWRYLRTKGRNAWWVLQTKGARGVWRNLVNEIMWLLSSRHTTHQADTEFQQTTHERAKAKVPDSIFANSRKVVPPSPRPTRVRVEPSPPPDIDRAAIGQTILRLKEAIRHSSAIKGRLSHDDQ